MNKITYKSQHSTKVEGEYGVKRQPFCVCVLGLGLKRENLIKKPGSFKKPDPIRKPNKTGPGAQHYVFYDLTMENSRS